MRLANAQLKPVIYLIVVLSGICWVLLAYATKRDLSVAADFFKLLPTVVTVDVFVALVFVKWGWKLPLFRPWLVPFPDLSGTWDGELQSDWRDPRSGEPVPPIPARLTVRQSFFSVSCVMRTSEMTSWSFIEGFDIEPERQVRRLAYSYTSKPRQLIADRSPVHDGTAVFEIQEKPRLKLRGKYWTDRRTTGEINLRFTGRTVNEEAPSPD